jgi:pimeloyl-ACP methyl ester carboxylesterase
MDVGIDGDGGQLRCEVAGTGDPVVLVHGFSLDRRMWAPEAAALARTRRVVSYDLRGFGASTVPRGPYSHVGDLLALFDALALGPVDLVGLSLGGAIAIDCALTHPERVRRVAVIDSTLGGWQWSPGGGPDFTPWKIGRTDGLVAARTAWMANPMFAPTLAGAGAERLRALIGEYSGWHWLNDDPVRRPVPPAVERLGEIRAPLLALVGEHDLPDFHTIGRRLESEAGAKLQVIRGAGHMATFDAPEACLAALTAFFGD